MKERIKKLVSKLISKILISAKRFPEAVTSAFAASVFAIILNRGGDTFTDGTIEVIGRIALVFTLLFPVSLIAAIIFERTGKKKNTRIMINAGILAFGLFYYFVMLTDLEFTSLVTYFAITLASYLLFISNKRACQYIFLIFFIPYNI